MKLILFLALCVSANAAIPFPVVTRPAPLLSPKHASTLSFKSKPMVKETPFEPASYVGRVTVTLHQNVNLYGCDTNDPGCLLWFQELTTATLRTGVGVEFQFADLVNATEWVTMAQFYPPPYPVEVLTARHGPMWQFPKMRFIRAVDWMPEGFSPASGVLMPPIVNQSIKGLTATVRKL